MDDRAVLIGDFVRSRGAGADALAAGFDRLGTAAAEIARWQAADPRLTRFRGDGWQMLLIRPALALRAALLVRADLRAADLPPTRIAIGLGPVAFEGSADLSDADGPAFHRAGAALDAMPRGRQLALAAEGALPLLPAAAILLDALSERWTVAQAEAVALSLPPDAPRQTDLADRLGIRQQSLADRLDAAGFPAIRAALDTIEAGA
ncbi:MarR family transcriptional regulator [Jannaschia ovalis]|uniref:MarR family transcriptional regulator n=1 Tax=Jannaschia ovalis TaxID=3038773 RepID=A0ABY8LDI0_9RHOB|nr:MarR family transcriptional regulator [Jannaschia sp. GRR-S6-38]WGH78238.1 MarR family transcriptional regulator [Jannaschia sp. GRR-S6-38]